MTREKHFQRRLLGWYCTNGRDLPWRRTRDPYRILVSEFMLQQTQVATVLPYYKEWLKRFPNFPALARASENDVLHGWQGLGYYSRARNLHATAKFVTKRSRGRFPKKIAEMEGLPGIGKYTAHAVATFAFNQPVPVVEANIARVLARVFDLQTPIDSTRGQRALWDRAASLLPKTHPAIHNSALLDLGALVCLPRNPKCQVCPVKKLCRAKNPELLPLKRPRPRVKQLIEKHLLAVRQNKILLHQATRRWRGMWILPPLNEHSNADRAIYKARFPFTNHQINLEIYCGGQTGVDNRQSRWFSRRRVEAIPIPSPHRRAIEQLFVEA